MHWPKSWKMPFLWMVIFCCCCCCSLGWICVAPNNILINHTSRLKWATHYYYSDTSIHMPTNYEEEQIIKRIEYHPYRIEHGDSLEKPISNHPSHSYTKMLTHTRKHTHSLHEMINIILFYICICVFLFGFDINDMWKHRNRFVCVYVSFTIQSAALYLHGNLSISSFLLLLNDDS